MIVYATHAPDCPNAQVHKLDIHLILQDWEVLYVAPGFQYLGLDQQQLHPQTGLGKQSQLPILMAHQIC